MLREDDFNVTVSSAEEYVFPSVDLLNAKKSDSSGMDNENTLRAKAMKLEDTLHSFNIDAQVTNVTQGPAVTRYEVHPNSGVKVKLEDDRDIMKKVTVEDLKHYGLIPEFLGRLPIISVMEALTEDMLYDILTKPHNALVKQYQALLKFDDVELEFDESALEYIAKEAMKQETGARALRAIIEKFMLDIMFEVPKDHLIGKVVITGDYIQGKGAPIISLRNEAALPAGE